MKRVLWVLAWLLAWPLAGAQADVVELATGQRVAGTIREVTLRSVVLERDGGTLTFERTEVRAIYFQPALQPVLRPDSPPSPTPARTALDALRQLESATKSFDVFEAYGPRLADARALVARFQETAGPADATVEQALRAALHYFTLASSALNPRMSDAEFAAIGSDPALARCPQFEEVFAATQRLRPRSFQSADVARNRGLAVSMVGIGAVWECASERITEADRLLEGRP